MKKLWKIQALDRFFFRDGSPFNAGESVWLDSVFPPSGRTLQGVVRGVIGDHRGVKWMEYREMSKNHQDYILDGINITEIIGNMEHLGQLTLTGPFLQRKNELLFSAPLDLFQDLAGEYGLLRPNEKIHCDIGFVRLPGTKKQGVKVFKKYYVTGGLMRQLLAGSTNSIVSSGEYANLFPLMAVPGEKKPTALADFEPKVGLARDNQLRQNKQGMLYSVQFVRPRPDVATALIVDGISDDFYPVDPVLQYCGGEGKLAQVSIQPPPPWPGLPPLNQRNGKILFKIVFTTPAKLSNIGWLPVDFTGWDGTINECRFTIVSACIGKADRIGGWDLAKHRQRDLENYIPAGSVYFCEADISQKDKITKLHGCHIGENRQYGFGHVLIGTWEDKE